MSSAKAEIGLDQRIRLSCEHAAEINRSAAKRRGVPIRSAFARDLTEEKSAPMARLIAIGGRGGEVLLKLYIALIWRSSKAPFTTTASARKLAELLALPNPTLNGARRVQEALKTLAENRLITIEHRRGEPSLVTLLREDGSGQNYAPPLGGKDDHYFKIPTEMWTAGQFQRLSAPALAMLIAVLSEQREPGASVWWSTTLFPARFGISPATRARGTRELQSLGLLVVTRKAFGRPGSLAAERVRNMYAVSGTALLRERAVGPSPGASPEPPTSAGSQSGPSRRPFPGKPSQLSN
jgi:hypothetical protein